MTRMPAARPPAPALPVLALLASCVWRGAGEPASPRAAAPPAATAARRFVRLAPGGLPPLAGEGRERHCRALEAAFRRHGWPDPGCRGEEWLVGGRSVGGAPLVLAVWGDARDGGPPGGAPDGSWEDAETTLVLCGVHGDEITPVKFCHDVLAHLKSMEGRPAGGEGATGRPRVVVLAPVANPDAFFRRRPTRTNARGVDVNRNLPTADWDRDALRIWRRRYRGDPRRYPGPGAASEPETAFQVDLIARFRPDKIISVHAPLTMLDYDGPESFHTGGVVGSRANRLLIQMSRSADGYRIKNYPFFPGSLGNYAGNERGVPTFTLELPSSDARLHARYWRQFRGVVLAALDHDLADGGRLVRDGR